MRIGTAVIDPRSFLGCFSSREEVEPIDRGGRVV
jgi:hypothetical protein